MSASLQQNLNSWHFVFLKRFYCQDTERLSIVPHGFHFIESLKFTPSFMITRIVAVHSQLNFVAKTEVKSFKSVYVYNTQKF